jgi:hypothetical protein
LNWRVVTRMAAILRCDCRPVTSAGRACHCRPVTSAARHATLARKRNKRASCFMNTDSRFWIPRDLAALRLSWLQCDLGWRTWRRRHKETEVEEREKKYKEQWSEDEVIRGGRIVKKFVVYFSTLSVMWTMWHRVREWWKGKAVPVHAMKAYRGSKGITPLMFNLGTRWRYHRKIENRKF